MTLHSKSFDTPDDQRTADKTQVDVVRLAGASVARMTLQPGWRWSDCVRPIAAATPARYGTWARSSPVTWRSSTTTAASSRWARARPT